MRGGKKKGEGFEGKGGKGLAAHLIWKIEKKGRPLLKKRGKKRRKRLRKRWRRYFSAGILSSAEHAKRRRSATRSEKGEGREEGKA